MIDLELGHKCGILIVLALGLLYQYALNYQLSQKPSCIILAGADTFLSGSSPLHPVPRLPRLKSQTPVDASKSKIVLSVCHQVHINKIDLAMKMHF